MSDVSDALRIAISEAQLKVSNTEGRLTSSMVLREILREDCSNTAARALKRMNVNVDALRRELDLRAGSTLFPILRASVTIADRLMHGWIGTEHFLLALVEQRPPSDVTDLLSNFGVTRETAIRQLCNILYPNNPEWAESQIATYLAAPTTNEPIKRRRPRRSQQTFKRGGAAKRSDLSKGALIKPLFEDAYFAPAEVKWNKLHLDESIPHREQLGEFYDGLIFANFPNGVGFDLAWLPNLDPNGAFVISLVRAPGDWEPFVTRRSDTIEELRRDVSELVSIARNERLPPPS